MEYSDSLSSPMTVFLHRDWRGTHDLGTYADPTCKTITVTKHLREPAEGQEPGGGSTGGSGTSQHCWEIDWPAPHVEITGRTYERSLVGAVGWSGSQIDAMRDASGLMYRRNRYYDPSSGRFTQEDPIGIAGGLNVYGFAGGDPVTYSDPYGLKITIRSRSRAYIKRTRALLQYLTTHSPTARRIIQGMDSSDDINVVITNLSDPPNGISDGRCTGNMGNCATPMGGGALIRFRGLIDQRNAHEFGLDPASSDLQPRDAGYLAHELAHAAGMIAEDLSLGISAACGGGSGNEDCAQFWETVIRDEIEQSQRGVEQ